MLSLKFKIMHGNTNKRFDFFPAKIRNIHRSEWWLKRLLQKEDEISEKKVGFLIP